MKLNCVGTAPSATQETFKADFKPRVPICYLTAATFKIYITATRKFPSAPAAPSGSDK